MMQKEALEKWAKFYIEIENGTLHRETKQEYVNDVLYALEMGRAWSANKNPLEDHARRAVQKLLRLAEKQGMQLWPDVLAIRRKESEGK